ncbi:helix-turn-helix domain-containing protein [Micromonospora eburnea]|nr:helix-turn-helix transcriptional regulator [Micromonospora eburnea]
MTMATTVRQSTGWIADDSTFGARLALVRQRMGWGNIAEAAKACGLPVDSWRNWERDNRAPRRITVIAKQISTASGCDYLWLLLGPDHGGEGGTTRQYFQPARLVAAVDPAAPSSRRPVRRTQPRRPSGSTRPRTAVAA